MIGRCFPGIFNGDIHYVGIWGSGAHILNKLRQTKAELCRELDIDYLIDDQLKHCIGVAEIGIRALLFGDYSWNQVNQLPKMVTRVKDWAAVLEYFNEQS
jgi:hypothetical protein